jgi:DHA1 family bicyclomycin/chloramphenicol resistance-like MFS transporter
MAVGQLNRLLVSRFAPRRVLALGLCVSLAGGLLLLLGVVFGWGLPAILPGLFGVVASLGVIMPNTRALAMAAYPDLAGTASALLGVLLFAIGALVAPLVGVDGTASALPMALVIAALGVGALLVFVTATQG